MATAIGLVAFLLVQGILAAYNVEIILDAVSRGQLNGYPSVYSSLPLRLATSLVGGAITYLVFAIVGMAIASRGHRLLFVLPAASYVLVPIGVWAYGRQPQTIGDQWQVQCFADRCTGPWFAHPWFGPLVDLALVLIPGLVVAVRVRARRWPANTDAPSVAAILAIVGLIALAGWTIAVIQNSLDLRAVVALGVFGIAIGMSRPWWPWLHVLLAILVAGTLASIVWMIILPHPDFSELDALPYLAEATWPIIVVALLATGWQPLAWLLRRLDEEPFGLLVAVNLLNVVDAVMTAVGVRSGGALEANPVVRIGGLPAKVIFVGVLTWLLYRRRPTALVWPATALLLVACYHVSGILVNGWRTG